MALEVTGGCGPPRFAVSAAANPTSLGDWALLNASFTVDGGSCPSLRHDGTHFYYLTGGTDIMIMRSLDLRGWAASTRGLVIEHGAAGDCVLAPSWFGAPSGYVPSAAAAARMAACGPSGNYGDDSDVDLVEWAAPFGEPGPPAVLLQYGSGDQATFGFSNLALYNGTMAAFLQSYFV